MCVVDPAWFVKCFIPPVKNNNKKQNKTTLLRLHSYLKSIANHAQVCMHFSDRESQGFIGFWAVVRYEGGWVGGENVEGPQKISYTVRTDTKTESEIWVYRQLFAFCNDSFTWRERETDRQTETDRQADRRDRQTYRETERDKQADRHTERETDRERQTDRETERETERETDRHTRTHARTHARTHTQMKGAEGHVHKLEANKWLRKNPEHSQSQAFTPPPLTLRKFVFDVCVYMFYVCTGTDCVDLTWGRYFLYEKSFEMCICLWRSLLIVVMR